MKTESVEGYFCLCVSLYKTFGTAFFFWEVEGMALGRRGGRAAGGKKKGCDRSSFADRSGRQAKKGKREKKHTRYGSALS